VVRLLINPDQRTALAADPALLAPAVEGSCAPRCPTGDLVDLTATNLHRRLANVDDARDEPVIVNLTWR
jgi:hypothetical protein